MYSENTQIGTWVLYMVFSVFTLQIVIPLFICCTDHFIQTWLHQNTVIPTNYIYICSWYT